MAFVFVFVTLGYVVFSDDGDRCPKGHMPWDCLSWVSIDRYERQLREDLPPGTSRQALKDYLSREKITLAMWADSTGASDTTPIALGKKLGDLWEAQLFIAIDFDSNDHLTGLRFRKSMIMP